MTDLQEVFDLATDRIETPDLARTALATAHRRRNRRRGAFAAVAAGVAVAGVIVVPRALDSTSTRPPTEQPTPPAPLPTGYGDPATQPVWDPAAIPDLPVRATVVREQLPVPATPLMAPQERPMTGVVLATADRWGLELLDPDGSWRRLTWSSEVPVYGPNDVARPAISSDGTRVATATQEGILVIDVTTGDERTIAWPEKFAPPRDSSPGVDWQSDDAGFVVCDLDATLLVGLDGTARSAPFRNCAFAVGDGLLFENDFERRTLVTWNGGVAIDESPFVQCERMVAKFGLVACTTGSLESGRSGPVVVDAATGDVVAYAPIEDPNATYSDNGGLTMLGFLDENTVVMVVGGPAYSTGTPRARHLVAWSFRTGALERIASGDSLWRSVAVAPALLE